MTPPPANRPRPSRPLLGAALAFACVAAGCTYAEVEGPPALYAPQAQGRAAVYLGAAPDRPHRDLGLVQAFGKGNRSHTTDVLHTLSREGRRMGCDAVSNVDVSRTPTKAEAIGVCIQWTDGGDRQWRDDYEYDARAKTVPDPEP